MCDCGFASFDLDEAFGTDWLLTASRSVDVGWVVLLSANGF